MPEAEDRIVLIDLDGAVANHEGREASPDRERVRRAAAPTVGVRELGAVVRRAAERWARSEGHCAMTLSMQCVAVSAAFVRAAKAVGVRAEVAGGLFAGTNPPDPHYWALVWDGDRRLIVDLTATQYVDDAPRVAVLTEDDPGAELYLFLRPGYGMPRGVSARDTEKTRELVDFLPRSLRSEVLIRWEFEAVGPHDRVGADGEEV